MDGVIRRETFKVDRIPAVAASCDCSVHHPLVYKRESYEVDMLRYTLLYDFPEGRDVVPEPL